MPRSTLTTLSLLVLIATACADQPRVAEPVAATNGGALASRGLATVSLVVTVSNADSLGNAYNIRNDGQGVYTDGLQNVGAQLDQYGTFAFNTFTGTGKATATRWVIYDFSSPVDPNNTYRPTPSNSKNDHFSTGASAFSPFTPLQNLGVNGNPSTECIYMGNGIADTAGDIWGVSFHKGNEDVANSPTAFAFVTRTSISPASWTITPVGSCSPNSNVASLRSSTGFLYGYYNIPFFFTLRAK